MKIRATVTAGVLLVVLAAAPALAQYPGTTSTTTTTTAPPGTTTTTTTPDLVEQRSHGTLTGATVFVSCGFDPNITVNLNLNGENIGTDASEGDGCARTTVAPQTNAAGPGLMLAAIRPTVLAQANTTTVLIEGRPFTARVGTNTLVVSGNVGGASAATRSVTHVFQLPAGAATSTTRGLARTGAMILRWSAAAAALIGVGAGLVIVNRRRTAEG